MKRYLLFFVAIFIIGVSLYFLSKSALTRGMDLQVFLRNFSMVLFGITIILFYYKYMNKKLLYLSYFLQTICVILFIIYFIITIKFKRFTPLIYIASSFYILFQINRYLYKNDDVLIIKILSIILFFSRNINYKLAWIYFENNNYEKSMKILKKYKDNKSYYLLAMNYEQLNDYNNALKIYTKILNGDNNERPDILYNRGAMYKKIGNYENAIIDFHNCIKCKIPDPKAYIALGVIKDEMGEYDEAKKLFIIGNSIDESYKEYIPEKYK